MGAKEGGTVSRTPESCILTNMCMIYDGDRILVEDRCDSDWPGITFPGGHVEPGESFVDSVIREVWEETGLTVEHPRLCGIKQFPTRDGNSRYIVLFFKTDRFSGELRSSEEGRVFWIHRQELSQRPLASSFAEMLEVFLDDELSENYYYREDGGWRFKNQ